MGRLWVSAGGWARDEDVVARAGGRVGVVTWMVATELAEQVQAVDAKMMSIRA